MLIELLMPKIGQDIKFHTVFMTVLNIMVFKLNTELFFVVGSLHIMVRIHRILSMHATDFLFHKTKINYLFTFLGCNYSHSIFITISNRFMTSLQGSLE